MNSKQKQVLCRIIGASVLLVALYFVPLEPGWAKLAAYLVPYLLIGYDILRKAWKGILRRQVFDECFLMAVATIGAFLLGEYTEGAAVMLFYQIGELFQSCAVGKSRRSIAALMDIRPDYAWLQAPDGSLSKVDPEEVPVGSTITVQPGERIPLDGVIISGETALDTAALTGESVPRSAAAGDEVVSGCVNKTGAIQLRTTKEFGESTASRILDLVENASSRKSRSEAFITRFARVYTPAVCFSALALAVLPPAVLALLGRDPAWASWLYRALTFLVISCPCALVISIPLSFFAAIGAASRQGVLVKGSNYLESLSQVRTVAFDKTGTMTLGVFEVAGVHHSQLEDRELLRLAALAESRSTHPIAQSIRAACPQPLDVSAVSAITELSGQGVLATISGQVIAVGNDRLMASQGAVPIPCHHTGTIVHVARGGIYLGHILIADQIRPQAARAIQAMKSAGVTRTVMLTGDRKAVGETVAKELGIDEVHAELMPDEKVSRVERLLTEKPTGSTVAFVGDGLNDAPVLSRADLGIAMGGIGSDAAIEAADVVLMDDNPLKIAGAIRLARRCMRIVKENIWLAIGIKLLCLVLGAAGAASMWLAIFADVGVMVLAVLNAIRILIPERKQYA